MFTYWYLGIFLIGIIIILALILAFRSQLLRDAVSDPAAFRTAAKSKNPDLNDKDLSELLPPFSLARLQLLMWTVIVSCSYIYVIFCLNADPSIVVELNRTALLLMGISITTTATAATIDSAQSDGARSQNEPSEGFFRDILSDEGGISIHRFQNVVWSMIAITVYLSILIHTHTTPAKLPTLDTTLLVLTGLSSVGYLGLKLGENSPKTETA
jgi:hypothetical protein